jgi:hypothetical protein
MSNAHQKIEDWSTADSFNYHMYKGWSSYVNGNHDEINGFLRRHPSYDYVDENDVRDDIAGLRETFRRCSLETPGEITVHRGMMGMGMFGVKALSDVALGTEIKDLGYVSTSTSKQSAKFFGSTILTIRIPKGHRVLAGNPEEHEIILDRDSKFVVTKVDGSNIEMDVLP